MQVLRICVLIPGQNPSDTAQLLKKNALSLMKLQENSLRSIKKNPTEANKQALRDQIGINYDKVVAKKKAKLEQLRQTAKDKSKIAEMQVIVDEMLRDRENRIEQTLNRFTDSRLKPGVRDLFYCNKM